MSTTAASAIVAAPPRAFDRAPLIPFWALVLGVGVVLAIAMYPFYGEAYVTSLLGKFLCYAIFALSIDLIWGFAGILSLGQAVYFGIGAYFVALSLKINYALEHPTRYGDSGLHGMERPDRAADLHATADQPAARYRRRADRADPACLPVRRDHLQTAYLRRVLRGHHPGRVH